MRNEFRVLKGGHKYGTEDNPNWDGYSNEIQSMFVSIDGKYLTLQEWGITKEESKIVHGLDIVGPVLNFYEVACMMKKNKKVKFRLLVGLENWEGGEVVDYKEMNTLFCGININFVATSEWVKV
jgi:hypothetical protein